MMEENKDIFHISELVSSYLAGTLSEKGYQELEAWKNEKEGNRIEFERICSQLPVKWEQYERTATREAFSGFVARRRHSVLRRRFRYACCAVAAVLICLGGGLLFLSAPDAGNGLELVAGEAGPEEKVLRPLLTFASGKRRFIAEDSVGLEDVARMYRQEVEKDAGEADGDMYRLNKIEVPALCEFIFTLPDGTKVWMNASSELSYPRQFDRNSRTIQVRGEVYMEVVKDVKRPFRVLLNGMQVEVLGTSFNVRSYREEGRTEITLAQGKVAVSTSSAAYTLRPGQQLSYDEEKKTVRTVEANLDDVLAWKRGYYVFRNSSLTDVAFALKCWYGVDMQLEGNTSSIRYTGVINKEEPLAVFLKRLESVSDVRCRCTGNHVLIH